MESDRDTEIIERMSSCIDVADAVKEGCEYISKEAEMNHEFNERAQIRRKELMDKGAGAAVIGGMKTHIIDATVQNNGLIALWYLSRNSENQVLLTKMGAGEAIENAMVNYKMNGDIQHHGCAALRNLLAHSDNKPVMMTMKVHELILNTMNNNKMNAGVQHQGCGALCNIMVHNNDNQELLMKLKAGETFINALNNHKMNADVQHHACGALYYLVPNNDKRERLIKMKAGEAIMNAINTHKMHEDVQLFGCGALFFLSQQKYHQELLIKLGIFEATINAHSNHKASVGIQQYCCGIFDNLSANINNRTKLMKLGVGDMIIDSLIYHKANEEVHRNGCRALASLITSDDSITEALRQGLDFKIDDLIQSFTIEKRRGMLSPFYSKPNSTLEVLNDVRDNIMQFEIRSPMPAHGARKEYMDRHKFHLSNLSKQLEEKDQVIESEKQMQLELKRQIEDLKSVLRVYVSEEAKQQQQSREVEEKKAEEKELMSIKLESYLSSKLESHDNYMINEVKQVIDNQIQPVIRYLAESKDAFMSDAEIYEMLLKVDRYERVMRDIENNIERITFEQCNQKFQVLIIQSEVVDEIDRDLIETGMNLDRETLKKKGQKRDNIRDSMVEKFIRLKAIIEKWKSSMQVFISSNEWQHFPSIEEKIKQINPKSIKNQSFERWISALNESLPIQTLIQIDTQLIEDKFDIFVGNEMIHDLIANINKLKHSAGTVFSSSNAFNEFIARFIPVMQVSSAKLMERRLSIEQELERIENELAQISPLINHQITLQAKRKQIKEFEEIAARKDEEIKSLELAKKKMEVDMSRRRKSLSQIEREKLEQQLKNEEENIKSLKLEYEDLIEMLIEELNEKYFNESGKCIFPDLNASYSQKSHELTISSSASSNDLIQVPRTMKIKSNRCQLLEKIGDGGFSSVYKMKMKKKINDGFSIVAFKQFGATRNTVNKNETLMIEKEIEMLSHLEHDYIVKVRGAIGDPDARDINYERMGVGIIMDYCENGSFRSLLDKDTHKLLNFDLIIHLLFGAAQGLEYLHNREPHAIIHGDIKSDNILIDKEYNAKLCDFGISKLQQTTLASTKGGSMSGTLLYKAPETFNGKAEHASDVYSFGCVILEMLTGERPWCELGNDVGAIVTKMIVMKESHDLSKMREDAKEELIDLMKRCLDYDKDKRPTMHEVRMELEKMMNNAVLIELDHKSDEYKQVESLFFPGGDKEGSLNRKNYRVVRIDKIRHLFAERRYDAELSNMKSLVFKSNSYDDANKQLLFHGTSATDPMKILNHPDAFMKDYSSEGFYGKGLYFAELARYSNTGYRYNIPNTDQYQMLACSIICGNPLKLKCLVNEDTERLSQKTIGTEFHSIHAGPHQPSYAGPGDDDSCMYIVYKDTQVLPKYLVTYESVHP